MGTQKKRIKKIIKRSKTLQSMIIVRDKNIRQRKRKKNSLLKVTKDKKKAFKRKSNKLLTNKKLTITNKGNKTQEKIKV